MKRMEVVVFGDESGVLSVGVLTDDIS